MRVSTRYLKRLAPVGLAIALVAAITAPADAATLSSITVTPSDPTANAAGVTYTVSATGFATGSINCLRLTVDTSAAFGSGSVPAGFSVTGNPGVTGSNDLYSSGTWTGGPTTATNTVSWTSTGGITLNTSGTRRFTFSAHAPTATNTFYVKVETFTNTGCTTPGDSGNGAFVTTDNTTVSVTVDPSFTFTVANKATACNQETGTYVDNSGGGATSLSLGRLSSGQTKASAQNLSVSTNAASGFSVTMRGTQATQNLRSTTNQWTDVAGSYGTPAAFGAGERFGYTVNDTTSGSTTLQTKFASAGSGNVFAALTTTDNAVMTGGTSIQSGTSCVSFQAAAAATTAAGVYTSTVIYTAIPSY